MFKLTIMKSRAFFQASEQKREENSQTMYLESGREYVLPIGQRPSEPSLSQRISGQQGAGGR